MPPLRYFPLAQLAQAAAPAPVQVPQLVSHAEQTRSAVAEQAVLRYWFEPQGAEHATQESFTPLTR